MEGVAKILEMLQVASTASFRSKVNIRNQIIDFSSVFRRTSLPDGALGAGRAVGEKIASPLASNELPRSGAGAGEPPRLRQVPPDTAQDSEPPQLPAALDPLTLALAMPAATRPVTPVELTPRADFANAVEELVRRIAWGGDRSSGTARIEFGAGRYRGGIILIRAEGRDVRVELELPSAADGAELGERLRTRLEEKGLSLSEVRVR